MMPVLRIAVLAALALLATVQCSFSASKKELPPGGEAALRLMALQDKGLIQLSLVDPSPLLFVEPLYWNRMTHQQKTNLASLALDFVSALNREQGSKYIFVFIMNMTTHEKLGTVFLEERRIQITR